MRKPDFTSELLNPSGKVARDDRGNAVWQWSRGDAPPAYIEHAGLAIDEDVAAPTGSVQINKTAAKAGYNPYETGLIERAQRPKRRDLRELSRWIELKKKMDSGGSAE
jgi:hypothetical protein